MIGASPIAAAPIAARAGAVVAFSGLRARVWVPSTHEPLRTTIHVPQRYQIGAVVHMPQTYTVPASAVVSVPSTYEPLRAVVAVPQRYEIGAAVWVPSGYTVPASSVVWVPSTHTAPVSVVVSVPSTHTERTPARARVAVYSSYEPDAAAGPVALPTVTLVRPADGAQFAVTGCSVAADEDSRVWSFGVDLASPADWAAITPGDRLILTRGAESWAVHVDIPSSDDDGQSVGIAITGRSPTVALDQPAGPAAGGRLASVAAAEVCAAVGLSLDWRAADWTLPRGQIGGESGTGWDILEQLAAAVGAVIESAADGAGVIVRPRHPVLPWRYASAAPDHVLDAVEDVLSVGDVYEPRPGYDRLDIVGYYGASGRTETGWQWEVADEGVARLVSLYPAPWRETINLRHTAGSQASVIYQGTRAGEVEDTVEIVDGQGRTSKPCHAVLSTAWRFTDLGAVTVSPAGEIVTALAEDSILFVRYTAKCHVWRVGGAAAQVQLVVEGDPAATHPAARITVARAPGTNAGEAVLEPLLTSVPALIARGEQELAEQAARRAVTLDVPWLAITYLLGALIECGPTLATPAWRGKIVGIRCQDDSDGVPTQTLTIERPA